MFSFRAIRTLNGHRNAGRCFSGIPTGIHKSQLASLTDTLIEVDRHDNIIGPVPKLDSHLAAAITKGTIHRAFSVFLFSKKTHALLVQKRCESKIVFPREWANTCCSHPLFIESEMENVSGDQIGIKRAAVKRLKIELGLSGIPTASLSFKEKILYRQLSPGGTFGESECDYILVGEMEEKEFTPNPDEIEETDWIATGPDGDRTQKLREFLDAETLKGFPPTPWFNLMVKERECLESWWSQLIQDSDKFLNNEDVNNGKIRDLL
jgi:isopentenyl-diphosphate delta-isomerase